MLVACLGGAILTQAAREVDGLVVPVSRSMRRDVSETVGFLVGECRGRERSRCGVGRW